MYASGEKKIFGPFDSGNGMKHADPMRVLRRFMVKCDGDINAVLARHRSPDIHLSAPATDQLIDAAVYAFGLSLMDDKGEGLIEESVIELIDLFFDWLKKKETPTESMPTPPQSLDRGFLELAGYPMASGSATGSISPASVPSLPGQPNEALTTQAAPVQLTPTLLTPSRS